MKKAIDKPRTVRLYDIGAVAEKLDEKRPFFSMAHGVYAVQEKGGKPTNFIRVSKKRGLKGKDRKRVRLADRKKVKDAIKFRDAASGTPGDAK